MWDRIVTGPEKNGSAGRPSGPRRHACGGGLEDRTQPATSPRSDYNLRQGCTRSLASVPIGMTSARVINDSDRPSILPDPP